MVSITDVDVMGDAAEGGLQGDLSLSIFVSTKLLAVKNPKLSILGPLCSDVDSNELRDGLTTSLSIFPLLRLRLLDRVS